MTLGECRTKIAGSDGKAGRLQDAKARLGVAAGGPLDTAILAGVAEYSQYKPRLRAAALAGAGAFDFNVTGLTGFITDWSAVRSVIYPYEAGQAQFTDSSSLDSSMWALERLPSSMVLRLLFQVPVGQSVLVRYTAQHELGDTSTIPTADDEAVADLGAYYACLALAGYYAQAVAPSITADVDDKRGKSDLWRSNASRWRESAMRKLGLSVDGQPLTVRAGARRLARA